MPYLEKETPTWLTHERPENSIARWREIGKEKKKVRGGIQGETEKISRGERDEAGSKELHAINPTRGKKEKTKCHAWKTSHRRAAAPLSLVEKKLPPPSEGKAGLMGRGAKRPRQVLRVKGVSLSP